MNESTVILTGVHINTPIYLGMKREYDFVHPIVDEFCRAAEFVPTPGEAPLHLVAGKGPFQRTVKDDGHMLKNCQTVVDNDGYTTGLNEKLTLFIGSLICL